VFLLCPKGGLKEKADQSFMFILIMPTTTATTTDTNTTPFFPHTPVSLSSPFFT
jgi:hypothetical protein